MPPLPHPAPSMITDARNTADQATNRIVLDVHDKLIFWEAEAAMFTLLTRGFKRSKPAESFQVEWFEKEPYPRELTVSGAQTTGDTSVEVLTGTGSRAVANSVWINRRTRETVLVTADPAADTLTVVRQIGGVNAAMNDGDVLEYIGLAVQEGADVGTIKSTQEVRNYNLTQIFRRTFGYTRTNKMVTLYGGSDEENETKAAGLEHKKDMELAFFFGKRETRTNATDGTPQRFLGGLEYWIQSNVFDFTSGVPMTLRNWTEVLEVAMKFGEGGYQAGPAKKWAFCGRRLITELEALAQNKLELRPLDDKLGIKVKWFQSTHGDIALIPVNVFNGPHAGYGFIVDLNHIAYRPLKGSDTKLLMDRQSPGRDSQTNEYLTECSLQVEVEAAHSLIKFSV